MGAHELLFSIEVVHGYFRDPAACRLRFEPDAATRDWLRQARCVSRRAPNGLSVYYELPDGPAGARPIRAQSDEPISLSYTVSALDPAFGLYSDGLAACETLDPGSPPLLVFDSVRARRPFDPGEAWILSAPASIDTGGLSVRPDFKLLIGLIGDLSDAGRAYRIDFNSRAATWKYLLIGDWAGDRPRIVDATHPTADLFDDPFADPDKPPEPTPLADGRMAISVRSTQPLAVLDRPRGQFQLWSRSEDGSRDQVLVSSLPHAAAANFAIETPGDPSTLVAEIFVTR